MSNNIIDEIRRMESSFCKLYNKRGKIICLDANTEAKLIAYIVYELAVNKNCILPIGVNSIGLTQLSTIYEILQNGIRHLGIILCDMKLEFDHPSFCIKGSIPGQSYPVNIPSPYSVTI